MHLCGAGVGGGGEALCFLLPDDVSLSVHRCPHLSAGVRTPEIVDGTELYIHHVDFCTRILAMRFNL